MKYLLWLRLVWSLNLFFYFYVFFFSLAFILSHITSVRRFEEITLAGFELRKSKREMRPMINEWDGTEPTDRWIEEEREKETKHGYIQLIRIWKRIQQSNRWTTFATFKTNHFGDFFRWSFCFFICFRRSFSMKKKKIYTISVSSLNARETEPWNPNTQKNKGIQWIVRCVNVLFLLWTCFTSIFGLFRIGLSLNSVCVRLRTVSFFLFLSLSLKIFNVFMILNWIGLDWIFFWNSFFFISEIFNISFYGFGFSLCSLAPLFLVRIIFYYHLFYCCDEKMVVCLFQSTDIHSFYRI